MSIFLDPENEQPITSLYAIVSRDKDGNEGIVSAPTIAGFNGPLVTSKGPDNSRILQFYEQIAKNLKHGTGKDLYVVEFTGKRDIKKL